MRWFKHFSDSRTTPQLRKIEKKLGEAGYARAFKLMELVAQYCGIATDFSPTIITKNSTIDVEFLAEEFGVSKAEARKTLQVFAEVSFIDPERWKEEVIHIPAMLDALDEWTGRAKRRKHSDDTPESLRRDSGKSQSQSQSQSQQIERKDGEPESSNHLNSRRDVA